VILFIFFFQTAAKTIKKTEISAFLGKIILAFSERILYYIQNSISGSKRMPAWINVLSGQSSPSVPHFLILERSATGRDKGYRYLLHLRHQQDHFLQVLHRYF
jgi:hypothetical protein